MRVLNIEDDTFKHKAIYKLLHICLPISFPAIINTMIFAKPCQDVGLKMSNGRIISRMAGNRLKTQWIVIIRMI